MKFKKLLATVTTMAVALCFSAGVCAKEYAPSYLQSASTSDAIDVIVTVEGNTSDTAFKAIEVSLDAKTGGDTQKVIDAMMEVQGGNNGITFYESAGVPATAATTYFTGVNTCFGSTDGGAYLGWCFRINGGIPSESEGWGASIASANITDGDVISFYLDDPSDVTTSTRFTRASVSNISTGGLTVNVKESHQGIGGAPDYAWTITDFNTFSPADIFVEVYSDTDLSTPLGDADVVNGSATLSGLSLTAGQTYYLVVVGDMDANPRYTSCITAFTAAN